METLERAPAGRFLTVDSVLGPGGALQGALPDYEHRPEQLRMARAVEKALLERHYLIAEAGTGTGKTLAYLVPAILSGRRVVVSTATKTLQEQIFWKDLPLLIGQVGLACEAAYLKGRSNYLCLHRFEQFDQMPEFLTPEEAKLWPKLRAWALETSTGDRAEAEVPDNFPTWAQVSSTSDNCLGSQCPLYESCHVVKARRRAEQAQLVVVNHALFFSDLSLRGSVEGAQEGILPSYEAVVFDEAHSLEDVAVQHFGRHLSSARLLDLSKDAQMAASVEGSEIGALAALAAKLRGDSSRLFGAMASALGFVEHGATGLDAGRLRPFQPEVHELLQTLAALGGVTADVEAPMLRALSRRAGELHSDLEFVFRAESKDHVYWAEERARSFQLRASPIDIGVELRQRLYPKVDTAIFTSATLATQGNFDFFTRQMGLSEIDHTVREVVVPSPFQFEAQAALYLPAHLPEPQHAHFSEAVAEELLELCRITQGRAFALFTSLRNMHAVHRLCRHRLALPVLLQGDAPKTVLLEQFRARPSVLFASHSFWEGVDVPGSALSLVVMDKLPFSSPVDPVVAARIDRLRHSGEDPFSCYQLPEAAVALRQGFGRLIRTRADRGIVAILDSRLSKRAYGRALLEGLPPARRFKSKELLERWFVGKTEPSLDIPRK